MKADERAKFYTRVVGPEVLTDGGIKQKTSWPGGRRGMRRWAGAKGGWRGGGGGQPPGILIAERASWLRVIRKEDGEECRWCGKGYEDGDHIVFRCEEMWRPEPKPWQKWRTRTRTTRGRSKDGSQRGEMEEWYLVEEFFNRIRDPYEEEED